ncbi:hypothetical protein FZC66_06840 [Priestia megaterium]|nr:hypothetical protein FZC66_06840 [Priestia megaterium]
MKKLLFLLIICSVGIMHSTAVAAEAQKSVIPLAKAHAHNDYEHERPLLDALDHGFTSVEADVWLENGELLVAHNKIEVKADRTLKSLYLDPLMAIAKKNHGKIYPRYNHDFILWVDIKSEDEATYKELHRQLTNYKKMLTKFTSSGVKPGAVTVYVSGNRPYSFMKSQTVRYAAYDGRMTDLGSGESNEFMPVISDSWFKHFTWIGIGEMPKAERDKLHNIVSAAHKNGQKVRFWGTLDFPSPMREAIWTELLKADVDFINTDDLEGLQHFLLKNDEHPSDPSIHWRKK